MVQTNLTLNSPAFEEWKYYQKKKKMSKQPNRREKNLKKIFQP